MFHIVGRSPKICTRFERLCGMFQGFLSKLAANYSQRLCSPYVLLKPGKSKLQPKIISSSTASPFFFTTANPVSRLPGWFLRSHEIAAGTNSPASDPVWAHRQRQAPPPSPFRGLRSLYNPAAPGAHDCPPSLSKS
jgi:hypothetical protein